MKRTQIAVFAVLCVVAAAERTAANVAVELNSSDGGFTVYTSYLGHGGPWQWVPGSWRVDGVQPCGTPSYSTLSSPVWTLTADGPLSMEFDHRYSFEYDGATRWDGGQVRLSLNGGPYETVPAVNFTTNGYIGVITGNNVLNGQWGFNGDSPGYGSGTFISSELTLGTFGAGDQVSVQFVAAWDECTCGLAPNWQIDRLEITGPGAPSAIPLPGAALLAGVGAACVGYVRRRKAI